MVKLLDIENILSRFHSEVIEDYEGPRAAVALVLCEQSSGVSVLFIERAPHDRDPWSGNVAFPGGKIEKTDTEARVAAERETMEEVGVDLREGRYLGRLSDIKGSRLPVLVSCFVYGFSDTCPLAPSDEVSHAFWVPLAELLDLERHCEATVEFAGETLTCQAIQLRQPGKPVLWGITYRLLMQFLELLKELEPQMVSMRRSDNPELSDQRNLCK